MAKTKGARKVHDRFTALWADEDDLVAQLHECVEEAARLRAEGEKLAIYNPPFAQKVLIKLGEIESRRREIEARRAEIRAEARALYKDKIEPYMERANPTVDERLGEIEARIDQLERLQRAQGPQWNARIVRPDDRAAEK